MKPFKRLNNALDRGTIKQVFDHLRNYMICAFILAVGTTELRQTESQFFDMIPAGISGVGVVAVGGCLMCFNLYDGIRRISRSKYHSVLTIALIILYLFFSVRVVEMAWDFRDVAGSIRL